MKEKELKKLKKYDMLDLASGEWYTVDDEYLGSNVLAQGEVRELFLENRGTTLKVVYKNGKEVYFKNIYGTWGQPTIFR